MIRKLALAAPLFLLHTTAAMAEGQSVSIKAGALGLGVEYGYDINERISVRGGLNGSHLGTDQEESGIDYNFDVIWDSLAATFDFHPFKGPFRLSLGLLSNDNRVELESRATGNVTVGDHTYTPQEVGTLLGKVGFDGTATVAGVGWDWSRKHERFGTSLDIGVVDQGSPVITLRGTGGLVGQPQFQADIAKEVAQLRDDLGDSVDLVPYLTFGFVFRF